MSVYGNDAVYCNNVVDNYSKINGIEAKMIGTNERYWNVIKYFHTHFFFIWFRENVIQQFHINLLKKNFELDETMHKSC